MFPSRVSLRHTTMFTYSHPNTPLRQSERANYLSYFIIKHNASIHRCPQKFSNFNRKILRTTRLRYRHIDLGIGIVLISLLSLSYILAFMDYWPHIGRNYTSFLNIVSV